MGESKFVFEARTIQRMELLVLSTLKWRMQAVTPFSFMDYFLYKLNDDQFPHRTSILRSTQLILSTMRGVFGCLLSVCNNSCGGVWWIGWWELNAGIDFLEFKPSEIAAAVAISVARESKTVDIDKAIFALAQHVQKVKMVDHQVMILLFNSINYQSLAKLQDFFLPSLILLFCRRKYWSVWNWLMNCHWWVGPWRAVGQVVQSHPCHKAPLEC